MSVKKLFDKAKKTRPVVKKPNKRLHVDVESEDFMEAKAATQERYDPHVIYGTTPIEMKNFVRYGSAKRYFEDAFSRIYTTYPYDGSLKEKEEWSQTSTPLDRYIFDNVYPRTNGYIRISSAGWGALGANGITVGYGHPSTLEYVTFYGGPTTGSATNLMKHFDLQDRGVGSNIYESYSELSSSTGGEVGLGTRESNLKFDVEDFGVTVEFWLKKTAFTTAKTEKEVIFDLWNGETPATDGYGRLRIELDGTATGSPFLVSCQSGSSAGFSNEVVGTGLTTTTLQDWSHYAVSLKADTSTNKIRTRLYVNGVLNQEQSLGTAMGEVTGSLIANIGALRGATTSATVGTVAEGYGKLSGSIDEFRYWKVERGIKEVGRHWFKQYAGGTNTDLSNTTLGVYYKFNEGCTGTASVDQTVLDYSGRLTNGHWVGYPGCTARCVDSAMVLAGAAEREFKDPILYSFHSDVATKKETISKNAKAYDDNNSSSIYSTIPNWILEFQENNTANDLEYLTQIMASEFDKLHQQISALSRVRDNSYLSSTQTSIPFTDKMLTERGMPAADIFENADLLAKIMGRSESQEYESDIVDIKNRIYHSIYNNLSNIFKSKGTEKAFRNLIRCFGVDEKLLKLNIYGDNATYKLTDNAKIVAKKRRYANFYSSGSDDATVVQQTASSNANSVSYITGSNNSLYEPYSGMTVEAEVHFPKKKSASDEGYFAVTYHTASLFGMHTVGDDPADFTFLTDDYANLQVYALRDASDNKSARFMLTSSSPFPIPEIITDLYKDVYEDQTWNLSVRLRPSKYPISDMVHGAEAVAATATITTVAEASINDTKDFTLTDAAGTTTTYNFSTGLATTDNNVAYTPGGQDGRGPAGTITIGVLGTTTAADIRDEIITRINAGTSIGFAASASGDNVLVTQNTAGTAGNTSITEPAGATGLTLPSTFTGGLGAAHPFKVEFHGLHLIAGEVIDEFLLTSSVTHASASLFLQSSKRLYMGAHLTNYTGSVIQRSDTRSSGLRYWPIYLGPGEDPSVLSRTKDEFKNRVKDIDNYGTSYVYRNAGFLQDSLKDIEVPFVETLALNWNFSELSSSNAAGEFTVEDESSGSSDLLNRYKWVSNLVERQHTGRGYKFAASSTDAIDIMYVNSYAPQLPETISSSDMVNILTQDDDIFTREHRPVNYYFAIEKSMYQTISEEILNMFASIVDFNNLIGDPVNRYRQEYKDLGKLRQLFFERIGNTPELDKYVEFYKWIDSGINEMLEALIPASVNSSDGARTMVESHVLERNKYWNKFPTIEMVGDPPAVGLRGITEMLYPWKFGHANPGDVDSTVATIENERCFWWRERAERTTPANTSGDSTIDTQREGIRDVVGKHRDESRTLSHNAGTTYAGQTYALNRFSRPYRFDVDEVKEIHGGVNYRKGKDLDFSRTATHHHGEDNPVGFPVNVILYEDSNASVLEKQSKDPWFDMAGNTEGRQATCTDQEDEWPRSKNKVSYHAFILKNQEYSPPPWPPSMPKEDDGNTYFSSLKGDWASPFSLYETTEEVAATGYHKDINDRFRAKTTITNLHEDSYGDNERPVQGPFTDAHVGGRQNRHIILNKGEDTYVDRPEAWKLLMGPDLASCGHPFISPTDAYKLGLVGPDYPHPLPYSPGVKPSTWRPRANYLRDGTAKRPVNIQNIKHDTGSSILGNYDKDYQVVSIPGRQINNRALIKSGGFEPIIEDSFYFAETLSEYRKPERLRSEHVFVTRFSAPGAPEAAGDHRGGFGLDYNSGEFSFYSSMNYRNLILRGGGRWPDGIRELLTDHTRQFGYFSDQMNLSNGAAAANSRASSVNAFDYSGQPNYHKTNRNTGYRLNNMLSCSNETRNWNNWCLYFHYDDERNTGDIESNYDQWVTIPGRRGLGGSQGTFDNLLNGMQPFAFSTWLKPLGSKYNYTVPGSSPAVNVPHNNKKRVILNLGEVSQTALARTATQGDRTDYVGATLATQNAERIFNFQIHLEPADNKVAIIAPFSMGYGHWTVTGSSTDHRIKDNEWTHLVVVYVPDSSLADVALDPTKAKLDTYTGTAKGVTDRTKQPENMLQIGDDPMPWGANSIDKSNDTPTTHTNLMAGTSGQGSVDAQEEQEIRSIGWKGDAKLSTFYKGMAAIDGAVSKMPEVNSRALEGATPLIKVYMNGVLVASLDLANGVNTGFFLNRMPYGTSIPTVGSAFLGRGPAAIRDLTPWPSDHPDYVSLGLAGQAVPTEWSYYGLMDETSFWVKGRATDASIEPLMQQDVTQIYQNADGSRGPNNLNAFRPKSRGALISWYRFHDQELPHVSRFDRITGYGQLNHLPNQINDNKDWGLSRFHAYTSPTYPNAAVHRPIRGGFSASTDLPGEQYINEYCTPVTSAYYDNWYVTHEIPRSTAQYTWISQSCERDASGSALDELGNAVWHHPPPHGKVHVHDPTSEDYLKQYNAISFTTESHVGSAYSTATGKRHWNDSAGNGSHTRESVAAAAALRDFIPQSFAQLNTNLYESLNVSTQALGLNQDESDFINDDVVNFGANDSGGSAVLNGLVLKRQGPYGWPSWKQIRGSEHPVVRRHLKNSSVLSIVQPPEEKYLYSGSAVIGSYFGLPRGDNFVQYTEPAVAYKKPMVHVLQDSIVLMHAYSNAIDKFSNQNINNFLNLRTDEPCAYTNLVEEYTGEDPTLKFNYLRYHEPVYPKQVNRYRNVIRSRPNYATSFYQSGRSNRKPILWAPEDPMGQLDWKIRNTETPVLVDTIINVTNSQGYTMIHAAKWATNIGGAEATVGHMAGYITGSIGAHSIWPMDARGDFHTITNVLGESSVPDLAVREAGYPIREYVGCSNSNTSPGNYPLWSGSCDSDAFTKSHYLSELCGELQAYFVQARGASTAYLSCVDGATPPGTDADGEPYFEPLIPHAQYHRRHTTRLSSSFHSLSGYKHGISSNQWNSGSHPRGIWTRDSVADASEWQTRYGLVAGSYMSGALPWHFVDRIDSGIRGQWLYGGQTMWEADIQSGKRPAYDSYEQFAYEDIRLKGQEYSTVPEFKISDHIAKYVSLRNSDFLSDNDTLFSLSGSSIRDSSEDGFYTTYSHSDFMKHFEVIAGDHADVTEGPSELKLRCTGIKKFLPYDGVYPMQRSLQLATLFSRSYADNVYLVEGSGSSQIDFGAGYRSSIHGGAGTAGDYYDEDAIKQGAWSVYMRPFFAPGILYNTVKSGVAVDFPVMTGSFHMTSSTPLAISGKHDGSSGSPSHNWDSYDIDEKEIFTVTTDIIAEPRFHDRIPFEAIIEPDKHVVGMPIVNMETHVSGAGNVYGEMTACMRSMGSYNRTLSITASLAAPGGNLYKMASNNFFAESIDFFLQDRRLSAISSLPESDPNFGVVSEADAEKKFMALVKIRKSVERQQNFNPLTGALVSTADGKTYPYINMPLMTDTPIPHPWTLSKETITMYSRPSAFGPPSMGMWSSISGYNMPYTPPYYDGAAWAILTFSPGEYSGAKKYTLDEILAATTIEYTRTGKVYVEHGPDASGKAFGATTVSNWPWSLPCSYPHARATFSLSHITNLLDTNSSGRFKDFVEMVDPYPQGRTFIDDNAMQISASVNLMQKSRLKAAEYNALTGRKVLVTDSPNAELATWVIQTKYETPILNFGDADKTETKTVAGDTTNLWGNELSAKGMWHQYGVLPSSDEDGIFLEIQDVPKKYLRKGMGIEPNEVRSLCDLVGFSTEPVKIGQPAVSRTISEAVVAVPFVEKDGERQFFNIPRRTIDLAAGLDDVTDEDRESNTVPGDSIVDMVDKMNKFVFPPTMNFLLYDSIEPFAMYIFEFTHELSQLDLTDMWQNLMPEIGRTFEEQTVEVSHPLFSNEVMGCEALLTGQKVQKELQWMVFKVKQKAKTNYYEKVIGSDLEKYDFLQIKPGVLSKRNNSSSGYSYNWPYDYFSLVELVKIDSEVTFGAIPEPDAVKESIKVRDLAELVKLEEDE